MAEESAFRQKREKEIEDEMKKINDEIKSDHSGSSEDKAFNDSIAELQKSKQELKAKAKEEANAPEQTPE